MWWLLYILMSGVQKSSYGAENVETDIFMVEEICTLPTAWLFSFLILQGILVSATDD